MIAISETVSNNQTANEKRMKSKGVVLGWEIRQLTETQE